MKFEELQKFNSSIKDVSIMTLLFVILIVLSVWFVQMERSDDRIDILEEQIEQHKVTIENLIQENNDCAEEMERKQEPCQNI